MVLILAQPPVIPPVAPKAFQGVLLEWIGYDGSIWDLTNGGGGVVLDPVEGDIVGLHEPEIEKYKSESYSIPGHRLLGWRTKTREVFWPTLIYADTSDQWNDTYGRFFRSIHPQFEGVWRATYAGQTRELRLTGEYSGRHGSSLAPQTIGWERFGITLEAAQPYWAGDVVTRGPWIGPNETPFYGDEGEPGWVGGPPFYISKAQTIGSATMTNPGDVDAFPTWTAIGPLADIVVGIGDALVTVPFDLTEGETLVIDTDPRHVQARLDGTPVTAELGFQRFKPIPPGGAVPIHVEASGNGSVSCSLVPLYFRAFG